MKRVLAVFGIFVLAVLLFAPAAFAEETPALTARSTPGDNGDISVTFSLGSLPEGTGISYAQIELSLQPGDFSLREDSFSWLPKDARVLVSPQWNSGRLLLLLEPQNAAFAGLDAQPLFSLRLQNKTGGKTGPVFQVTYILIDRAGKETLYTGLCETSGQNQPGSSGEDSSPSGSGPLPVSPDLSSPVEGTGAGVDLSRQNEDIGAAISGWVYPLVIGLAVCLLAAAAVIVLILRKKKKAEVGAENPPEEL